MSRVRTVSVRNERHPLTYHNNSPVISYANRCAQKLHVEWLRHLALKHEIMHKLIRITNVFTSIKEYFIIFFIYE